MKITETDLIQFILAYGEAFDVRLDLIEALGVERVLEDASHQAVAATAFMKGATAQLQAHTNAQEALRDYFGDGGFDFMVDWACDDGEIDFIDGRWVRIGEES